MAQFWENDAVADSTPQGGNDADFWKKDEIHTEEPALKKYGKEALGVGEAALSQITGTGAAAYGGLKGLLTGATNLAQGKSLDQAAQAATNDINQAAQDYTYQPRTKTGETINKVLALPVEGLKYVGGGAGGAVGKALGNEDAGRAVGETVAQAVPVIFGGKAALKSPITSELGRRLSDSLSNPSGGSKFGKYERGSIGFEEDNVSNIENDSNLNNEFNHDVSKIKGIIQEPESFSGLQSIPEEFYDKLRPYFDKNQMNEAGDLSKNSQKNIVNVINKYNDDLIRKDYPNAIKRHLNNVKKSNDEIISNAHKNSDLDFNSMSVNDFNNLPSIPVYKSPTYGQGQSSEYRLFLIDNEPVLARKSNHWGKFYTNIKEGSKEALDQGLSNIDEEGGAIDSFGRVGKKEHNWNIKDSNNELKNSQAGYIKLSDLKQIKQQKQSASNIALSSILKRERGSVGVPPEEPPVQTPLGGKGTPLGENPSDVPPIEEKAPIPSDAVLKKRGWSDSEIERIKRYDKQGIDPMLGDITREPSAVRFQDQSAARGAGSGGRHYDVYAQKLKQNDQLYNAFDNLKEDIPQTEDGETSPITPEDTSRAIRDDIETKRKADKEAASNLYKAADESGETLDLVDPYPLDDLMYEMRNAISVPEVKRITSKWEELKKKNEYDDFSLLDDKGNPINPPSIEISIRDLENLRKEASKLRKASPSANFYLKDVINKIDEVTDGKGGDLYKAARKGFSDYQYKYKTLKGIKDVTDADMFSGEYRVPEEQLFNKLVIGKTKGLEGFKNVYDTLNPETQNIVRNQIIQYIQDEGFKGQKSLQSGQAPFSPANIHRAIQRVGEEKLKYILGEQKFKDLQDLSRSATELKAPSYRVNGSDTYANFASRLGHLAIKGLKQVPGAKHATSLVENLLDTAIEDSKIKKYLNPLESRRRYNRQGGGTFTNTGRKLSRTIAPASLATKSQPNQQKEKGE